MDLNELFASVAWDMLERFSKYWIDITKKSLLEDINNNLLKMFNLYKQTYYTAEGSVPSISAAVSLGETTSSNEVPTNIARENSFQEH